MSIRLRRECVVHINVCSETKSTSSLLKIGYVKWSSGTSPYSKNRHHIVVVILNSWRTDCGLQSGALYTQANINNIREMEVGSRALHVWHSFGCHQRASKLSSRLWCVSGGAGERKIASGAIELCLQQAWLCCSEGNRHEDHSSGTWLCTRLRSRFLQHLLCNPALLAQNDYFGDHWMLAEPATEVLCQNDSENRSYIGGVGKKMLFKVHVGALVSAAHMTFFRGLWFFWLMTLMFLTRSNSCWRRWSSRCLKRKKGGGKAVKKPDEIFKQKLAVWMKSIP